MSKKKKMVVTHFHQFFENKAKKKNEITRKANEIELMTRKSLIPRKKIPFA